MTANAYSEGREAYCDGRSLTENPYKQGTSEYEAWENGWNYAEENDPLADDFEDSYFEDSDFEDTRR